MIISNVDFNCLVTAESTRFLYYSGPWTLQSGRPCLLGATEISNRFIIFCWTLIILNSGYSLGPNSKSCSSPSLLFFCWKIQLDTKISRWACSFLLGSPYYPDFSVIHQACSSSAAEWSLLFESSIETLSSFLVSILFLLTWQSFPAALTFSQMPSLRIHTN